MQRSRYPSTVLTLIILLSVTLSSCSPAAKTAEKDDAASGAALYPSWYTESSAIKSDENSYFGYGAVIAADSAAAARKAEMRAINRLQTAVSVRLESIRNEALSRMDSKSGLDDPRFILALRKAEDEVMEVAEIVNRSVDRNRSGQGYHGFAKAAAGKETLIAELDRILASEASAWDALKGSQAFRELF